MERHPLNGDCELLEQSILNRYPLILVECHPESNASLVRLRLSPDAPERQVRITTQDYLNGVWEKKVDKSVRELYSM